MEAPTTTEALTATHTTKEGKGKPKAREEAKKQRDDFQLLMTSTFLLSNPSVENISNFYSSTL